MTDTEPVTSVIIPAHNESAVIGRLLAALLANAKPDEFEVVVVCNGCTDNTAQVAREHGPNVQVIELADSSKRLALIEGDAIATSFPRLYIDADVVVDTASARALVEELDGQPVLAAAPYRRDVLDRSSWSVRAYYRVWARLPAVQEGLFGRGVLAVSEAGFQRIRERPPIMGDDLYVDSQFAPTERRLVAQASSAVFAPRTVRDLLLRRTRAAQGNAELRNQTHGRTDTTGSSARALARLAVREPALWPQLMVFATITLVARRRAAAATHSAQPVGWLRDESSRA
jgi:Glycosyl transferase family 2